MKFRPKFQDKARIDYHRTPILLYPMHVRVRFRALFILCLANLLFYMVTASVIECGGFSHHQIRQPSDCISLSRAIREIPYSSLERIFRFDPRPPLVTPYVPLPYVKRMGTCALVLYVDPIERYDSSSWRSVGEQFDDIYSQCRTTRTRRGGKGTIGSRGHLVVGMVYSYDAENTNWTLNGVPGFLETNRRR